MDLTTLSRQQKLTLYEAIQEKKRRLREKRDVYKANPGQMQVHKSPEQIRCVFSGNGAGKTALGVNEAFWALQGWNPERQVFTKVPAKVIVVLDKPEKVEEVWLPEIKKWFNLKEENLKKHGKPYISAIQLDNGSELRFMFHLQEELSFESIEVTAAIFDEPPPRHCWTGLRRGGRTKNRDPWYLFIGTPLGGSWMRKELFEPWSRGELPEVECFKFGTSVNEANLADGYIEKFSKFLTEKERRSRLHGDWFDLDGLALAHLFDRSVHLLKPSAYYELEENKLNPCVVAIDPHEAKPHTACLLSVTKEGGLIYEKEMASTAVPRQFARELKQFYQGHRVLDIVCDSFGARPISGGEGNMSFIQVLQSEGIRVRSTSYADKQDEAWISKIKDILAIPTEPNNFGIKTPKLRILSHNKGLINDIETVQWQRYKNEEQFKPKLSIGEKDYLSVLKYALTCNLVYNRQKSKIYNRTRPVRSYGQR